MQTQLVPARTNHLLHLLLSLFTLGFWVPVWFIVALYNHNRMVPRTIITSQPTVYQQGWYPPANAHPSTLHPSQMHPATYRPQDQQPR